MRDRGELEGKDPWGNMNKPAAVAASGSGSNAHAPVPNYAGDLSQHPALQAYDVEEPHVVSRPASPDQLPTITKGKGKGRVGKPEETYESRYGPAEVADPDSDHEAPVHSGNEEDDDVDLRKSKVTRLVFEEEDETESEPEATDIEEDKNARRGRRPQRQVQDDSREGSRAPRVRKPQDDAKEGQRARSSSSRYSQGEDNVPNWQGPPAGEPPAGNPALGKKSKRVEEDDSE